MSIFRMEELITSVASVRGWAVPHFLYKRVQFNVRIKAYNKIKKGGNYNGEI